MMVLMSFMVSSSSLATKEMLMKRCISAIDLGKCDFKCMKCDIIHNRAHEQFSNPIFPLYRQRSKTVKDMSIKIPL